MSGVDDFVKGVEAVLKEVKAELILKGSVAVHRMSDGNMRVRVTWDGGEVTRLLSPEAVDRVVAMLGGTS